VTATAPANRGPLRIGILVDSLVVPQWVHSILAGLQASDYAEIHLVLVNASPPPPRRLRDRFAIWPEIPYIAYAKLDYRLFRGDPAADAFAPIDARGVLAGVTLREVVPRQTKFVDRFTDEDLEAVRSADLDILLRFGFRILKGPILQAARFGMWSYHHGDNRHYRGGPALFWEMKEGNPESGVILQVLNERLDDGRVIYRSIGATDPSSLFRNRNAAYWKAARFVERCIADLHRRGADAALPEAVEAAPSKTIYRTPRPAQMARFLARTGLEMVRRQATFRLFDEQWFVAWAPRGVGIPGIDAKPRFQEIASPPGRYLADPFVVERDGRVWLFVESCTRRLLDGVISVIELRDGRPSEPVTVLAPGYHVSYPAVFEFEGEWFMTPETASNGTVELYRAVEFPWRWELDRVLLSGVRAVDPTLFTHEGRVWLATNIAPFGGPSADELHLFYSDSPRGPFKPHRGNPVVSDVRRARPAGRPFVRDGKLYRPAQDCAESYGRAITLNCIERLDPDVFHEAPVGRILPDWLDNAVCTHTLNMTDRYVVTDGKRWIPRGREPAPT
jgi:hypothetical protein